MPDWWRTVFTGWMIMGLPFVSQGVETVVIRDDQATGGDESKTLTVVGEVLVEARDGGMMLQSDDGRIWTLQPERIVDRQSDEQPLQPVSKDEMAKRLLAEFPNDFRVYQTANYLIAHNTDDAYARQVGSLFEQLHKGFFAFWRNQRWRLEEPRFPLVAVVFKNRAAFLKHATDEIGEMGKSVIGYYHLESNRMVTFKVPNLERNIATIIHEATHQLAYNCGLQQRFADNPMWVSEGMATFFEAPDFSNPRGWRAIGRTNVVNLARWHKYIRHRPQESLMTLIADDSRFRGGGPTETAYAESWALTYFLLKTRRKAYIKYLRKLSEGKPLIQRSRQERLKMFEETFDTTLEKFDRQLVNYMMRVR